MIDLHSDTIYRLVYAEEGESLLHSKLSITKKALEDGKVGAQCFALYVHDEGLPHSPWKELNILHDRFVKEITEANIPQIRDINEYDGSVKAILTTEEGSSIEGDASRLSILKEWGVMSFGLTWNFENELGYPNSKDKSIMEKGLKENGFEAVSECERLGIAVDVSHLSDGGFWDVVKATHGPFLATHSNSRAMTDVSRNLTDEMIRALADKGGVMGLTFHPSFLPATPNTAVDFSKAPSRISDMVRHVEHIYQVGGENILAIGTDFDGIYGDFDIPTPASMHLLFEALAKRGMPSSVIDKLKKDNAIRVFRDIAK